ITQLPCNQRNIVLRNLPMGCFPANLLHCFVDVVYPVDVALGKETTVCVDGKQARLAVKCAVSEHCWNASWLAESIPFDLREHVVGEAVVEFSEVDVLRTETCSAVSTLGDRLRG